MLKIKSKKLKGILLGVMCIIIICNSTLATTILDEQLKSSLQTVVNNVEIYKSIEFENNVIKVTNQEGTVNEIEYDLTGEKPTFTMKTAFTNGMTYSELKEKEKSIINVLVGYLAVANINEIGANEALKYFTTTYSLSALDLLNSTTQQQYNIIDDTDIDDDVTIEVGANEVLASKVQERNNVMLYLNSTYGTSYTLKDDENVEGLNSYFYTIKMQDVTENSCNIVSKIEINLSAEWNKISVLVAKLENSLNELENSTEINNEEDNVEKISEDAVEEDDETEKLPYTGNEMTTKEIITTFVIVFELAGVIVYKLRKK